MTLRIHMVGGVGAFGQNCMVIEDLGSGDALVVDAGAGFPREGSGHELLIADPAFIRTFAGRLRAYLLTHGHEDHIGAVGWWCQEVRAPVYGAATTLSLVREKCEDVGLPIPDLVPWDPLGRLGLGAFTVTSFAVSHSIPDSLCLLLEAGGVSLLHSGDFRVDKNPVAGPATDMSSLSALGCEGGVDALLADSTGAIQEGHNPGERSVQPSLAAVFESSPRRIFLTTFASHIQRLNMVADLSARFGRRILLCGRGTLTHTRIAGGLGNAPWVDGLSLHPSEVFRVPPERLTVLLGGCQGEENSAFWRQAHGDARLPPLQAHDTVIHSARAVPGNEGKVATLLDLCARRGARVVDGREGVHVSGHGHREDLRELIRAVRPRVVLPIHGGTRHLRALSQLAGEEGIDEEMAPVFQNGDVVDIGTGVPPARVDHRHVDSLLVDEQGVLTPASGLLDARRELMGGVVMISASVNAREGALRAAPTLTMHGLGGAAVELLAKEGAHEAHVSFNALGMRDRADAEAVQNALARGVRRVLRRLVTRPPVVMAHAHVDRDAN
jgi:ribonuclease J